MTEKGTTCYMSEKGHNNFYYPTDKKMIIKPNCNYEVLPWLSGRKNLTPVKIKISCILPTSFDKDPAHDIIRNNEKDASIVVWIEKQ